ncbi:MAG: phosphatase PAP2 family protein [Prevotella sp.]|nr:phosphatase PAP2 family protein [Prevotella sp.]
MVQGERMAVKKNQQNLFLFEWAVLSYAAFTLVLMAVYWRELVNPMSMLSGRAGVVAMTLVLWQAYRRWPSKLTMVLRVIGQLCFLGWWYPDTYEFNRLFLNLDHVFAGWEQAVFGCQPALLFSQIFSSPVVSELLSMGYVSYFPMIGAVAFYYFWRRYDRLDYAVFVILASFFLFYVIFIFLPVAGPQFYYEAVGMDEIAQGHFPNLGHYFFNHQEMVRIPGLEDGLFHNLVQRAHDAGERPTAAFPSSHVGISIVLCWLAWEKRKGEQRAWGLFVPVAILTLLMFFATFYIQAHYAIDAFAGLLTGTVMYFLFRGLYSLLASGKHRG